MIIICGYGIMDVVPRGRPLSKSRRRDHAPRRPNENLDAALPRILYFMPTHLLFSIGFNAPKALGKPQYLAPVAQTIR